MSSISPNGVFDGRYASNLLFSIASISAEVRILIDSLTFGPPSIGTLYPSISPKPSETSPQVVLEVTPLVAHQKYFASDKAVAQTANAVQIFGGSAYIRGFEVERLYSNAKITQIYKDTNQIQRTIIA